MRLVLLCLALAGCSSTDPCASIDGACLGIHVNGTGSVDQLRLILTGSAKLDGRTPMVPGPAQPLPIDTAISLPASVSGAVQLTVVGFLAGNNIGRGQVTAQLVVSHHQTLDVTLVKLPGTDGGTDGGTDDLSVGDLGTDDLAGTADLLDPDLGVRYTFVLPARNGALGTITELDTACTQAAAAASLPGSTYRALVAYRALDPANHVTLTKTSRRVILPSGKLVATDDTFFSGAVQHVGNIDELNNKAKSAGTCAWTNFSFTGNRINTPTDCNDWQDVDAGAAGSFGSTADPAHWNYNGNTVCTNFCHIYCIQQ